MQKHNAKFPVRVRLNSLNSKARRFGYSEVAISEAELTDLLAKHDGKCALCGKDGANHVDHCHSTGKVRGILCTSCNMRLGVVEWYLADQTCINEYLRRSNG